MLTSQQIHVHDNSDAFMPITLHMDPELINSDIVRLSDLVRSWYNELGMCAALTTDQDLVCLQVDRFVMQPDGRVCKYNAVIGYHFSVDIPHFTHGIEVDWIPYQVVAASAHLGDERGGHYQSILSVAPEALPHQQPAGWLHCDDHRAPRACWTPPKDFDRAVTLFWLCKCDGLMLHDMRFPSPELHPLQPSQPSGLTRAMLDMMNQMRSD